MTAARYTTFIVITLVVLANISVTSSQPQIEYRFTARKFLFSRCQLQPELTEAWGFENGKPRSVPYSKVNGEWNNNCLPFRDLEDGTLKGHADFEALGFAVGIASFPFQVVDPASIQVIPEFCEITQLVDREKLFVAPSGIPSPIYFQNPDPTRTHNGYCDNPTKAHFGRWSITSEANFNNWFRDNPTYNQRVGFKLALTQKQGTQYTYEYGKGKQFFPMRDTKRCLITDGRLDCSNGGQIPPTTAIDNQYGGGPFSFTTEYHGHFQFRGGEEFSFDGDDDMFVFINGKMAVDVGGLHPAIKVSTKLEGQVAQRLGLFVIGGIYSLDIFHAERHTDKSNFAFTTSLAAACNVVRSGSIVIDMASQPRSQFATSGRDTDTLGSLQDDGNGGTELILTELNKNMRSSNMFYKSDLNVQAGYIVEFEFSAKSVSASTTGGGGSDMGFAFLLVRSESGVPEISGGGVAGHLGMKDIPNAIAVVFDFCVDRNSLGTSPCSNHRISLNYGNQPISNQAESRKFESPLIQPYTLGNKHKVSVVYYHRPHWIEVYIDDSLYLLAKDILVDQVIGGEDSFMGFTAATGQNAGDIKIHSWTVQTVDVDPETTQIYVVEDKNNLRALPTELSGEGPLTNITIGEEAVFAIKSTDLCENKVSSGGNGDSIVAALVSSSGANRIANNAPSVTVKDQLNGFYYVSFRPPTTGTFEIVIAFGNCKWNDQSSNGTIGEPIIELGEPNESKFKTCWNRRLPNAILVVDPSTLPGYTAPPGPPSGIPDEAAVGLSMGILSALFLGVGAFAFAKRYQVVWVKNQQFIEPGKLVTMDETVDYSDAFEANSLAKNVLDSRLQVLDERSKHAGKLHVEQSLGVLTAQTNQIRQHLKSLKIRKQLDEPFNTNGMPVAMPPRKHFSSQRFGIPSFKLVRKSEPSMDPSLFIDV